MIHLNKPSDAVSTETKTSREYVIPSHLYALRLLDRPRRRHRFCRILPDREINRDAGSACCQDASQVSSPIDGDGFADNERTVPGGSKASISPPVIVLLMAPANVLHGAVRLQWIDIIANTRHPRSRRLGLATEEMSAIKSEGVESCAKLFIVIQSAPGVDRRASRSARNLSS